MLAKDRYKSLDFETGSLGWMMQSPERDVLELAILISSLNSQACKNNTDAHSRRHLWEITNLLVFHPKAQSQEKQLFKNLTRSLKLRGTTEQQVRVHCVKHINSGRLP